MIKDTIKEKYKMIEIIYELSKIFGDLFSIKFNSLIGKVVILVNKNFNIPSRNKIKEIIFKEYN